jgi:hypothetical protein
MPRRFIRSAARTAGRRAIIAKTAAMRSGQAIKRHDTSAIRHKHYQAGPAVAGKHRRAQPGDAPNLVSRLHELADLKAMGALTDKEFATAKSRVLND